MDNWIVLVNFVCSTADATQQFVDSQFKRLPGECMILDHTFDLPRRSAMVENIISTFQTDRGNTGMIAEVIWGGTVWFSSGLAPLIS